uniref:ATP synthase F0 subunit 8 n=1 Tax=Dryophiops rubescens TaxID=1899456 RepID=UPI00226D306A|nr:ATP synthase F0 subunit 8 [Dryophiops rubescens]UZC57546.1 ATP synthase F0 subunit 8 [Dryophiops rubescens]
MPQLDTIFIYMIFMWTWLMMYTTAQKIKNFTMIVCPQKHEKTMNPPMPMLPW